MPITARYILVCDDVRREDNGKMMVIGLYLPDMIVPQIPFILPTLTFFCILDSDRPGNFSMRVKLRHEDAGRDIAEAIAMLPIVDPTQPVICPIKFGNAQINSAGLYSFSLEIQNQVPIVQTLNVQLVVPRAGQQGGPPMNIR
jgi:hypothetical protein